MMGLRQVELRNEYSPTVSRDLSQRKMQNSLSDLSDSRWIPATMIRISSCKSAHVASILSQHLGVHKRRIANKANYEKRNDEGEEIGKTASGSEDSRGSVLYAFEVLRTSVIAKVPSLLSAKVALGARGGESIKIDRLERLLELLLGSTVREITKFSLLELLKFHVGVSGHWVDVTEFLAAIYPPVQPPRKSQVTMGQPLDGMRNTMEMWNDYVEKVERFVPSVSSGRGADVRQSSLAAREDLYRMNQLSKKMEALHDQLEFEDSHNSLRRQIKLGDERTKEKILKRLNPERDAPEFQRAKLIERLAEHHHRMTTFFRDAVKSRRELHQATARMLNVVGDSARVKKPSQFALAAQNLLIGLTAPAVDGCSKPVVQKLDTKFRSDGATKADKTALNLAREYLVPIPIAERAHALFKLVGSHALSSINKTQFTKIVTEAYGGHCLKDSVEWWNDLVSPAILRSKRNQFNPGEKQAPASASFERFLLWYALRAPRDKEKRRGSLNLPPIALLGIGAMGLAM